MKTVVARPSAEHLRLLPGLGGLSGEALERLTHYSELIKLPAGNHLFQGSVADRHIYYVLEGELTLRTSSGEEASRSVPGILHLPPRAQHSWDECLADTPATVIRMRRVVFQKILRNDAGRQRRTSSALSPEKLAKKIAQEVQDLLARGELEVPSLPSVGVRIARHLESAVNDNASIARIIQADPALTARLIQVANSSAFGGRSRIDSCRDAVTRLGRKTTRDLITGFVLKNVFRSRSRVLKRRMQKLWEHSTHVAAICHAIAQRFPGFEPGQALLAGLVHDIGVIPIINHAESYPQLLRNPAQLDDIIRTLRSEVGAITLDRWQFAAYIVTAARDAENWWRDPQEQADYADLVLVAQIHSFAGTERFAELPPPDQLPAFGKLALGPLSPRQSIQILDAAESEILAVQSLFL